MEQNVASGICEKFHKLPGAVLRTLFIGKLAAAVPAFSDLFLINGLEPRAPVHSPLPPKHFAIGPRAV
jgi:hypothetical protein